MPGGASHADAFHVRERAVLEQIVAGAPLRDLLTSIVRLVEAQAPGMLCSILLVDLPQQRVRSGAAPSLPAEFSRAIDGAPIGPAAGSCGTAAYRGERVIVEDIATHPAWAEYRHLALPHGLRACWSSPIFSATREVLGTFAMYYREPRGPLPQEVEWVDAATHLATIALRRDAAAHALRRSEARYRRLVDNAQEGIWLVDGEGRTLFANHRVASMLGRAPDTMARTTIFSVTAAGAVLQVKAKLGVGRTRAAEPSDVCFRRADGADVWAIVSASPVTDDDGSLVGTLLMVTDITERKRAEARLQQIARLYDVSSGVNEAIVRVRDSAELYEQACRIAVERGRLRLAWVGLYDAARQTLVPAARFGADDGYVDGIVLDMGDPLMSGGPAGRALRSGAHAVDDDIAAAPGFFWKAEALARGLRSCGAFPLTIKGAPIGVLLLYAERTGFFGNEEISVLRALADDISFAVESAATEADRRRLVYDLAERVKELTLLHRTARLLQADHAFDAALLGELVTLIPGGWQYPEVCEARIAWGDLEARTSGWRETPWMQSVSFAAGARRGEIQVAYLIEKPAEAEGPFLAEEGALLQSLADMLRAHVERHLTQTAMRESEERLWRAQRIQSLGTLAGGIAHDFNNVLTAVAGNALLAAEVLSEGHPAHRHLERIRQASARATDLVRRILTFSRDQEPQRRVLRLQDVVDEVLKLLASTLPATIQIQPRFTADVPSVLADATQVHQVVMNLGTNAAHAMGDGGLLEIDLAAVQLDASAASAVSPDLAAGRYVRLDVRDSGCGMDRETLQRIFEPFFTTKPVGQGTGLGLSVVHGIMKSHKGAVTVESEPGRGTTFMLYFPAVDAAVADGAPADPAGVRGRGERILYVDDEESIVEVGAEILETLGYQVTGVTSSVKALEAFRSSPDDFDAVVADLTMPGLSGLALARRMRAIRPGLPFVLTSGYVRTEDAEAVEGLGAIELVPKPAVLGELGTALRRLLD